jgi:hypothetical protein
MPQIKLIPHVGIEALANGQTREVTFDQEIILVDGVEVGIVGKHANAGICIHRPNGLPESTIAAIKLFVSASRNEDSDNRKVAFPPKIDNTAEEGSTTDDE